MTIESREEVKKRFEINVPRFTPSDMAAVVCILNGLKVITQEEREGLERDYYCRIEDSWLIEVKFETAAQEYLNRILKNPDEEGEWVDSDIIEAHEAGEKRFKPLLDLCNEWNGQKTVVKHFTERLEKILEKLEEVK